MSKTKILLVDDDEADRADLEKAAAGLGEIETAASSQEAITKLVNQTFDLVVTDLRLKDDETADFDETAGFKVLSATKPDTPVIVVTRYPSQGRSRTAVKSGAFDFLDRTASGVDYFVMLQHKIAQALEWRRARQSMYASEPR